MGRCSVLELTQVVRRIVGRHWLVISLCVLAGIALPIAANRDKPAVYSAEARLSLDVREPTSAEESTAIADSARALATSTKLVDSALTEAGVTRDAQVFASENVSLDALGTSGVLSLTVRDTGPETAAAVANALAQEMIQAREELAIGNGPDPLNEIGEQLADLNGEIVDLQTRANTSESPALDNQLAELTAQRTELEAQRSSILVEELSQPDATVIDLARPPVEADPSGMIPTAALGLLLGLLAGVGAAAGLEILSPTMVGSAALARSLESPVLGPLKGRPEQGGGPETLTSVARIRLAARAAGVDSVELVDATGTVDLSLLARSLSEAIDPRNRSGGPNGTLVAMRPARSSGPIDRVDHDAMALMESPVRVQVKTFDEEDAATSGGSSSSGLVVVAPNVMKHRRVEEVRNLLATIGWPVLGVITYRRHAFASLSKRPRRSPK